MSVRLFVPSAYPSLWRHASSSSPFCFSLGLWGAFGGTPCTTAQNSLFLDLSLFCFSFLPPYQNYIYIHSMSTYLLLIYVPFTHYFLVSCHSGLCFCLITLSQPLWQLTTHCWETVLSNHELLFRERAPHLSLSLNCTTNCHNVLQYSRLTDCEAPCTRYSYWWLICLSPSPHPSILRPSILDLLCHFLTTWEATAQILPCAPQMILLKK